MICGTCRERMSFAAWRKHIDEIGCDWQRATWEKVVEARKHGHSGKRLLAAAYPHLWQAERMTDETREKLRALGEQRVKVNRRRVTKRLRRKATLPRRG